MWLHCSTISVIMNDITEMKNTKSEYLPLNEHTDMLLVQSMTHRRVT